jgi:copper transport protein
LIRQARRVGRRASLAVALVGLMLFAGAASASAHSYFIQSDPADGSILEQPPKSVVLVFSSAVAANFTDIVLVEAGGTRYTPTSVTSYPGKPNIVVVALPPIPKGSYRLSFATRDAVDLHRTSGTIVFGVGTAPPASEAVPGPAPAQPSEVVLRWLALAGLAAVLGGVVVSFLVVSGLAVGGTVRAAVQHRLVGLSIVGAVLVLIGETGLLLLQASSLGPVLPSIGRLLAGSEFGTRWLVTAVLELGLVPLLLSVWRTSRRTEMRGLIREIRRMKGWGLLSTQVRILVLCAGLTAAVAFSGHVAGESGSSIGGLTLLTLHVGAMAVWAGGVLAIAIAMLELRRSGSAWDRANVMAIVVGFGPLAAVSFATLGVTGLLLAGLQVATVTALLSTPYGTALIAKVGLIALVAILGLRHARWTWRGLSSRVSKLRPMPARLSLTVGLEAAGALGVVLLASLLGASAPAQGPQFAPLPTGPAITQLTQEQDGLLITVSVKPNQAGPNLLSVLVANTRRPAPGPVQQVTVLVVRPGDAQGQLLPTTQTGSSFDAGAIKLDAGDVRFTVTVDRTGIGQSIATLGWHVAALPIRRAQVVVSDQPIAPIANTAALVAGIAALTIVILGVRRIRQRRVRASGGGEPGPNDASKGEVA